VAVICGMPAQIGIHVRTSLSEQVRSGRAFGANVDSLHIFTRWRSQNVPFVTQELAKAGNDADGCREGLPWLRQMPRHPIDLELQIKHIEEEGADDRDVDRCVLLV